MRLRGALAKQDRRSPFSGDVVGQLQHEAYRKSSFISTYMCHGISICIHVIELLVITNNCSVKIPIKKIRCVRPG
jgi:hypothetical protein